MLRKDAHSHEGNYVAKATVLGAAKCPSPLMSEGRGAEVGLPTLFLYRKLRPIKQNAPQGCAGQFSGLH